MGAEFIEKATKVFQKSWDKERIALSTADLFTRTPDCATRTAKADIIKGESLTLGEHLTVEAQDGKLIARKGMSSVAQFSNPPSEIVNAVAASCGIAKGIVEQVHPLAGVAEISLC